jgi:hypothetical protein
LLPKWCSASNPCLEQATKGSGHMRYGVFGRKMGSFPTWVLNSMLLI